MHRRARIGITCAVTAMAAILGGQVEAAPRTAVIEMVSTTSMPGQAPMTTRYRLWWKGDRLRMETRGPGGGSITLKRGRNGYAYDPARKLAHRVALPDAPASTDYPFGNPIAAPGFRKTGKERVGAYACDIYEQAAQGRGGATTRVWMAKGVPVPVKTVTSGSGFAATMSLTRLQRNVAIPDSQFELPRGTRVVDAPKNPALPR
jgi:outer membrane lipoprotein-sorting protein